jgi:nucleotide-binding universal stress UspA family protein
MFRHILVPLDGSRFAEHALPRAFSLAARHEAVLELASVAVPYGGFPPPVGLPADELMESARARAAEYLEDAGNRVRAAGFEGTIVRTVIPAGNVVRLLSRHVVENHVDLTVMTTHGRGPLGRAWLGSTADGLIRRATVPLLLVRPSGEASDDVELEAPPPFARILVPLDGSKASERLVPLADGVAGRGASMILLRTVQPAAPVGYAPYLPHVVEEEHDYKAALKAADEYLHAFASGLNGSPATVELEVRPAEHPAEAILDLAEEEGVDLIAMATAGLGGVKRLLIGSVADKVIRGASVPLLVFRQDEEEAEA